MKTNLFKLLTTLVSFTVLASCASIPSTDHSGPSQVPKDSTKEIVFIHGMFVTPKSWENWEKYFTDHGYKVSAPAWPLHEGSVVELRDKNKLASLAKLDLPQVVEHYRKILKSKKTKPIVIGHSMGGLIAQILLAEGLAEAAIAIDSAPANGVIVLNWSFLKSNWGVIKPFADLEQPIELDKEQFAYAFLNAEPKDSQEKIYNDYYVPESRRVGKGPTQKIAEINTSVARGPLLFIAGGDDHIIPPKLNFKNFKEYEDTPAQTEFKLFPGRDHWIIGGNGWEEVAAFSEKWLTERFRKK